jgi:hypothetical protein
MSTYPRKWSGILDDHIMTRFKLSMESDPTTPSEHCLLIPVLDHRQQRPLTLRADVCDRRLEIVGHSLDGSQFTTIAPTSSFDLPFEQLYNSEVIVDDIRHLTIVFGVESVWRLFGCGFRQTVGILSPETEPNILPREFQRLPAGTLITIIPEDEEEILDRSQEIGLALARQHFVRIVDNPCDRVVDCGMRHFLSMFP